MTKILEKLNTAIAAGAVLALIVLLVFHVKDVSAGVGYWGPFVTFLHVVVGVVWIGLLYYFNLVQIPTMPKIPAELKPGVGKFIAPEALFWFRWGAAATVLTGLIIIALTPNVVTNTLRVGVLLGLIMAFNVWFIIWPNQKKALGIVTVDDAAKAKAARVAMLTSRANFILSVPMLYCMVTSRLVG
jgi:uncharacterized membrane protein